GALQRDALIDKHRRSARRLQKREVAAIGEERDLPGLRLLDAGNTVNFHVGRAFQAASELLRNFNQFHDETPGVLRESRTAPSGSTASRAGMIAIKKPKERQAATGEHTSEREGRAL